ncbi:MAG: hypothetical protein KC800_03840 [Candidatus Eremiobacteraeota bacterium]|nr:hypothetical protein [Candidatus Eremiobacteraeota bacterium]
MNRLSAAIAASVVLFVLCVVARPWAVPVGLSGIAAGLVLLSDLVALPVPRRGFLSNAFVWVFLVAQESSPGFAALVALISLAVRYLFMSSEEILSRARHLLSELLPQLSALTVLAILAGESSHGFPLGLLASVFALVCYYLVGRLVLTYLYAEAAGPHRELLTRATGSRELQLRISTVLAPAAVQLASGEFWRSLWLVPVLLGLHQFFWEKLSELRELSKEGSRRLSELRDRETELYRQSAHLNRVEGDKDLLQRCLEEFSTSADMRATAQTVLKLAAQSVNARCYALFWNAPDGFGPLLALDSLLKVQEIEQDTFPDRALLARCFKNKEVVGTADGRGWCFPLHEDGLLYLGQLKTSLSEEQRDSLTLLARQATFGLRSAGLFERLRSSVEEAESARREAEEAHRELEVSQAHLVQSSKLAAVGQMAAGVAHELNSPLAAILVAVQAARRSLKKGNTDKLDARFDQCEEAVEKARTIADGLLSRSRGEGEMRELSLAKTVEETLRFLSGSLKKSGVIVQVQIPTEAKVTANPDEITQILTNLLMNAQQSMSDRTEKKVSFVAGRENGAIHLDVTDGGQGIAPEQREKIFQPFFTTKTGGEGTGLGLYLSSELAARNGAKLDLLKSDSEGSTFRLTFEQN